MNYFRAIKRHFTPFLKRMTRYRSIGCGEMIPHFYGIAWRNFERYETVCLPIPLNLIAGGARRFWFLLIRGFQEPEILRLRQQIINDRQYHDRIEKHNQEQHRHEMDERFGEVDRIIRLFTDPHKKHCEQAEYERLMQFVEPPPVPSPEDAP